VGFIHNPVWIYPKAAADKHRRVTAGDAEILQLSSRLNLRLVTPVTAGDTAFPYNPHTRARGIRAT
jgi:hypothetical protein